MNFKQLILLAGAVASASAQLNSLPKCAITPAISVIGGQQKCQLTEFSCICANQDLLASLTGAVQKSCTDPNDLLTAKSAADSICAPYATLGGSGSGSSKATVTTTPAGGSSSMTGGASSVTAGAPYGAGNATTAHATSGSTVSTATGSPIVTGSGVKAAAAGVNGGGFFAAIVAIIGIVAFF